MPEQPKAAIIDCETSGFNEDAVVIETARMPIDCAPLQFMRAKPEDHQAYDKLYGMPEGLSMQLGAMATHGILPEKLEGLEPFRGFNTHSEFVIGHNVAFDVKATGYQGAREICTLELSRFLWPHLDSHTQSAVMLHIGAMSRKGYAWALDLVKNAHRAGDDVVNCARVLKMQIYVLARNESTKHHVESWSALADFSEECKIPTVMRFGKHKGKRIEEVEQSWVDWYLREPGDKCSYLLEAFKRAGKIVTG